MEKISDNVQKKTEHDMQEQQTTYIQNAKMQNVKNYNSDLQELNKQLKRAQKQLEKEKRKRIRARVVGVFLCVLVLLGTVCIIVVGMLKESIEESEREELLLSEYKQKEEELYAPIQTLQDQIKLLKKEKIENGDIIQVESTVLSSDNKEELNSYVASLKRHSMQTVELKKQGDEQYYQLTRKYDVGEYTIMDSGNPIIFPGAILRGDSLFQGALDYTLVSAQRTPMKLVSNQQNASVVEVQDVSYGTVMDALKSYHKASSGEQAKMWTYYLQSLESTEQLELSLGVKAKSVGLNFGNKQAEKTSTVAIIYKQIYYSVNAEPLKSAADYFQTGTDFDKLGSYEPAYVSSVDYGRMIVVFVTGNMEMSELSAGLEASIQGVGIGAAISNIKENNELQLRVLQFGGKSANINEILEGEGKTEGLKDKINKLFNGSEGIESLEQRITNCLDMNGELLNPVPLSYSLKYLSDNAVVPTMFIEKENLVAANDARTVKISLTSGEYDAVPGTLQLDVPDAAGMIVSGNTITISEEGKTDGEIVLIWDKTCTSPIIGTFNGKTITLDLHDSSKNTELEIELASEEKRVIWSYTMLYKTFADVYITDAVNEMQ